MRELTEEELEKVSGGVISHTIGPGDTIISIANMYSVTPADIIAANPWIDPECLIAGYLITIPC